MNVNNYYHFYYCPIITSIIVALTIITDVNSFAHHNLISTGLRHLTKSYSMVSKIDGENKKVVVIGGTGRTGRLIVENLMRNHAGIDLRIVVRDPSRAKVMFNGYTFDKFRNNSITFLSYDIQDCNSDIDINGILSKADILVSALGTSPLPDPSNLSLRSFFLIYLQVIMWRILA